MSICEDTQAIHYDVPRNWPLNVGTPLVKCKVNRIPYDFASYSTNSSIPKVTAEQDSRVSLTNVFLTDHDGESDTATQLPYGKKN